jgi:polygalacturonase
LDVVNCKNIRFENSFIRTFDDNIVVRGTRRAYNDPFKIIENVTVDNCVLWNDWGRAIEIGASIVADTIRNITFSNCMITHFTAVALDIQNCDRGVITDIHYKNIDIEGLISDSLTIGTTPIVPCAWGKIAVLGIYSTFYSEDTIRGKINNITFENIRYNREYPLPEVLSPDVKVPVDENSSFQDYDKFIRDNMYFGDIEYNAYNDATFYFSGFDNLHQIENILIKDYYIDNVKVNDLATFGKNEFVSGISIR